MSLGGIAIAVGAMVDAAVVMIENAHKHIERWEHEHPGERLAGETRWRIVTDAAAEVGPALFLSLVIITLSFVPVFSLQAQEGRLFAPLAFTKSYAMAAAAILSITLVPVLMGYLIRGRIPAEADNPLNRALTRAYRPALDWVMGRPRLTLVLAALVLATTAWPLSRLGGEFLPNMDEGDLLYMPSALPGLSAAKASELLQQTDRMILTVPEVKTVFGKAGRAETATDPAPGQCLGAPYPQSHRHAGDRDQEPDRGQGLGRGPGRDRPHRRRGRTGGQEGARGQLGPGRAADRRPLRRCRHRPRRRRPLRPEHR
jgi:Cu(I)/Ag(I) efflux system membrane protein CusA/SilA